MMAIPRRELESRTTSLPHPTHHMPHLLLHHNNKFHSHHLHSLWDSITSPQSTLSSTLASIQGSSQGSSNSTFHMVDMLEKMKLEERDSSKYHSGYGIQSLDTSNVGVSSLLQLSRVRQEQIDLSENQKLTAYRGKSQGQISQQFQEVVDVECDNRGRTTRSHNQTCSRGTSTGTGVFLPRGRTSAPSQSRKRPGKGCSTVLIPARVVQALQLHFEQMAATSGPKAPVLPPLHDVLVSNKDGMYSLQKRESRNKQNEMILPQEWTY